jgi:hypothetical protein
MCSMMIAYSKSKFVAGFIPLNIVILGRYNTVELVYNVIKESEYYVSLQTSVVINEEYNIVSKSEELIGIAELLTL